MGVSKISKNNLSWPNFKSGDNILCLSISKNFTNWQCWGTGKNYFFFSFQQKFSYFTLRFWCLPSPLPPKKTCNLRPWLWCGTNRDFQRTVGREQGCSMYQSVFYKRGSPNIPTENVNFDHVQSNSSNWKKFSKFNEQKNSELFKVSQRRISLYHIRDYYLGTYREREAVEEPLLKYFSK